MNNEEFDSRFTRALEQSLPPFSPNVKARALEAVARCRPVRARLHLRRRLVLTTVIVVAGVLAGLALWQSPGRRGDAALAAMVRAMTNVKSAHFIGEQLDLSTENYVPVECWVKGPTKLRFRTGEIEDEIHDGQKKVVINLRTDPPIVRISSEDMPDPGMAVGLRGAGLSYLNLFRGEIALERMDMHDAQITSKEVTLPDGRAALVVEAVIREHCNIFTIAADTDLIISWERYDDGRLRHRIHQVEYDIEIPDSVFVAEIPEGAIVVDRRLAASTTPEQSGKVSQVTLDEPVPICTLDGGYCGSPFHTRLNFKIISGPTTITYLPRENVYRVQGEARVRGLGVDKVVKNADFLAPEPPDVTVEQWHEQETRRRREAARMPPSEVKAWREAMGKELTAAGAKGLGSTGGMYSTGGISFEVLNNQMVEIWYLPSRNEFYVMGKVMVHRGNFSRIVEDGWVKVPGPAPKLPEHLRED